MQIAVLQGDPAQPGEFLDPSTDGAASAGLRQIGEIGQLQHRAVMPGVAATARSVLCKSTQARP